VASITSVQISGMGIYVSRALWQNLSRCYVALQSLLSIRGVATPEQQSNCLRAMLHFTAWHGRGFYAARNGQQARSHRVVECWQSLSGCMGRTKRIPSTSATASDYLGLVTLHPSRAESDGLG
jgi:hypothetical protein